MNNSPLVAVRATCRPLFYGEYNIGPDTACVIGWRNYGELQALYSTDTDI